MVSVRKKIELFIAWILAGVKKSIYIQMYTINLFFSFFSSSFFEVEKDLLYGIYNVTLYYKCFVSRNKCLSIVAQRYNERMT